MVLSKFRQIRPLRDILSSESLVTASDMSFCNYLGMLYVGSRRQSMPVVWECHALGIKSDKDPFGTELQVAQRFLQGGERWSCLEVKLAQVCREMR